MNSNFLVVVKLELFANQEDRARLIYLHIIEE